MLIRGDGDLRNWGEGRGRAVSAAVALILSVILGPQIAHAQAQAAERHFKLLRLDGNDVRWPHAGDSFVLTYRVLDEAQSFAGARNCRSMQGFANLLDRSRLSETVFRTELRAAFAMWERAANVRFREAEPGEVANILVGAQADPEGWAFADVFYDATAVEPIKPITRSLVCLNPQKRWKVGFDGDLSVYDLRYTLAHEIGHAIGLDHPSGAGQIMGYRYEERFRTLQDGDVSGAVAIYGPVQGTSDVATSSNREPPANPSAQETATRALQPKP